jgi:hypothetical protein
MSVTSNNDEWIDERKEQQAIDISEKLVLNIFRFIKKYYKYLTAFLFGVVLTALFMK